MDTARTASELKELVTSGSVCMVDVLLPEDFACRHIAGAASSCVYEMIFLDRITELVPDKDKAIVVYDDSGTTLAARTAQEKMVRAGYSNVRTLAGGLKAWQEAGFEVESGVPVPPPVAGYEGIYHVDAEKSVVEWTGRNINNRHYGRIAVSGGEVVLANGRPVSGRFVLDMNSISDLDIQEDGWRNMLL